ncbi:MAG: AAA family ATPase [Chloroflexota bacterium]|nr:AAA family ATPase [Chloroflexota bacterium]MDE2908160.1 AAA family ATPase [Chloroflexota bacterium]
MHIEKLVVKNYRRLKYVKIDFNQELNIIVGNNETGKSTILEAINLALTGQLNGRSIRYELHPFLFNNDVTEEYLDAVSRGANPLPPEILIEIYLSVEPDPPRLKGRVNSMRENQAGVSMKLEFDEDFSNEYRAYVSRPDRIRNIPIEYYKVTWRSFADEIITARSIPIKPSFIDSSRIHNTLGANRYVVDLMKDHLTDQERAQVALAYRALKDEFAKDPHIRQVNEELAHTERGITDKTLSVALDTMSRSGWDSAISPHLDAIPLPLAGRGEQNAMKIKLATVRADDRSIFLLEEPENHLSFGNMNLLLSRIEKVARGRQLIVATHSSFVLNKLGLGNILIFDGDNVAKITDLDKDTEDFFRKLPGHDTLRMILARKVILVEGPSDELIVQKAYLRVHGMLPIENGVDVISVNLTFRRFLAISTMLSIPTVVVTDNDGKVDALKRKYNEFCDLHYVEIFYDDDEEHTSLEPQLIKFNTLDTLNRALDKTFETKDELLKYMTDNKTESALRLFSTEVEFMIPEYIQDAIAKE